MKTQQKLCSAESEFICMLNMFITRQTDKYKAKNQNIKETDSNTVRCVHCSWSLFTLQTVFFDGVNKKFGFDFSLDSGCFKDGRTQTML